MLNFIRKGKSLYIIIILFIFSGSSFAWNISGDIRDTEGEILEELTLVEIVTIDDETGMVTGVFAEVETDSGHYVFEDLEYIGVYVAIRGTALAEDTWYYRSPLEFWDFSDTPEDDEISTDVHLGTGGRISGSVVPDDGGEFGENDVRLVMFPSNEGPWTAEWFSLETPGDYSVVVPEGDYIVSFEPEVEEYFGEYYNDKQSPWVADEVTINSEEITGEINAELERGSVIFGSIQTPEGGVPDVGSVAVEIVRSGGFEFSGDVEDEDNEFFIDDWDEEGNWTHVVRRGIYSFRFVNTGNENYAETWANGSLFAVQADWTYIATDAAGPFNFELTEGGSIAGMITDPEGNPVEEFDISIFTGDYEFDELDWSSGEVGSYEINGLAPGDYWLIFKPDFTMEGDEEDEDEVIDPDKLWLAMYSGSTIDPDEKQIVAVSAGESTEVNIQVVEGGGVEFVTLNPDGEAYDLFEQNVFSFTLPVDEGGDPIFDVNSDEHDNISWSILPEGTYSGVALAVYAQIDPEAETPNVRRTFYGGGFTFEGAETFEIIDGEITEIEIRMVEGGQTVSGRSVTEDGDPAFVNVFMVDSDENIVSASFLFFLDPADADGSFEIHGVPDGDFYLAGGGEGGHLVSTWYPNIADPYMDGQTPDVPDEAEAIQVAGADVTGLELVVQSSENFMSIRTERKNVSVIEGYELYKAFPNPFNNRTHIVFNVAKSGLVKLTLHDVTGRKVADIVDNRFSAGMHHAAIDAAGLAAGTYLVRMEAGDYKATRKVMLVK